MREQLKTLEQCKEYLIAVNKKFDTTVTSSTATTVYCIINDMQITDEDLFDCEVTAEELLLLNTTDNSELLEKAIEIGSEGLFLLLYNANLIVTDDHGYDYDCKLAFGDRTFTEKLSLIHFAAWFDYDNIVEDFEDRILNEDNSSIVDELSETSQYTPLMIAAMRGNFDTVKKLVEIEAELELKDKNGDTALHHAARGGYKDILDYLNAEAKDEGLDLVNIGNNAKETPNSLYKQSLLKKQKEMGRKEGDEKADFNRKLASAAICAFAAIGVAAAVYYNRAFLQDVLKSLCSSATRGL